MRSLRDALERIVELQTLRGPEVTRGSLTATPVARSVTVRVGRSSGVGGGGAVIVRSWPSAVLVSVDGRTSRVRVVNATRWAQIAIMFVALLWIYEVWSRTREREERS